MGFIERLKKLGQLPNPSEDNGIKDYLDVLDGTGKHAGHARAQDGQYVRCSCGTVAMGVMDDGT
jgi:hypothetical protein